MNKQTLLSGTVHTVPTDLRKTLTSDTLITSAWNNLTLLARNEWICWIEEAKLKETRKRRIERTEIDLLAGKRRPCCWQGCPHRVRNGR